MRAIEFYGEERLDLVERPDPVPADGELLIAPTAVGICGTDLEIFDGSLAYFRMGIAAYPIVPGHEWTGVVVDVGRGVTGFSAGDRVVGEVAIGCGVCVRCRAGRSHLCVRRTETGIVHMDGAMASRIVFPAAYAHRVALEPRAAALVEPTSVALHAVRRGNVAGRGVLIVGAGTIGLLAAQCALAEGAASVLVTDPREDRVARAAALGFASADAPAALGDGDLIDVAILCAGGPAPIASAFAAVRPGGTVVALGLCGAPTIPFDFDNLVVRDMNLIGVLGSVGYWDDAIELIEHGRVLTEPLVSATYPLERVRDALERLARPGALKVLVTP
ncbi:MAG TPA: alcohol dehydrogenase catalytic domain-containing protein [Solirubrobacter sp.]|nr:alcohol dehydrogenase catalytic domain-containing protein [Solirubrobacter sp.]